MSFFQSEDDDMPSPAYMLLMAPVVIPGLAIWGAYHGVKALIVHGPMAAVKKLKAASAKP